MPDNEWNPTFVTPDGEPVEVPRTMNRDDPHRDPEVLRDMYHRGGLTIQEIGDYLDVSIGAIRNAMEKHGIELRDDRPEKWNGGTSKFVKANGNNVGKVGPLDFDSEAPFTCPDCGAEYETRTAQHECIRAHARNRADELRESGVF